MFGKKKEKKPLGFKMDHYSMEDSYESNKLVVGNLRYVSSEPTPYGPMVITTEQKYIFEVIEEQNNIMYKEVFTGFKASDKESGYFDLPYLVNASPLTETLNDVATILPKYSLLLVLNEINKKPKLKILKKDYANKVNK